MKKTNLALMLSLALLSGCSSLVRSDFEAPLVDVPDSWQTVSLNQNVHMDPWWKKFNDPVLDQLINQALKTNNDLTLATLTVRRAQLQTGLARDDWYPQVSASAAGEVSQVLEQGDSDTNFNASASVSYEVDLWGRIGADVDAAKWSAVASMQDREATAQSLVATTATLYWQILYLNESLKLARQDVVDSQKTLGLVNARYNAGDVSRLEVVQAEQSLASSKSDVSETQNDLNQAHNALAILFNQAPQTDTINQLIDENKSIVSLNLPQVAAGVPSDVLIRRPDVKASLYQLKSALASKDSTYAAYLPTLSLTGAIGESSEDLEDLLRDPIGTLGAQLVLPFLQWNRMQVDKKISDVDYQTAVVNYRKTLYTAFQDVDNALSDRQNYFEQAQHLTQSYHSTVEEESIYQSRFDNGAVDLSDLIDAQQSRRSVRDELLLNKYYQLSNQAVLYQVLGGQDIAPKLPEEDS